MDEIYQGDVFLKTIAMSGDTKKKIAFNYLGSKFTIVNQLISLFPEHYHFVDLFCGSLVVTLNKPQSKIETANDINGNIINFFKVLRDQPDELIRQLELTPYSREEFNKSWHMEGCDDLEKARRYYVRLRQSFNGYGAQKQNKGWSLSVKISRCNTGEGVSKFNRGINKLNAIISRLKNIQFDNRDFRNIIPTIDYEQAFFYCDPPYPRESRGSYFDYMFEFTDQDHEDLAELLNNIKGKAMISGYECPIMNKLYKGWYTQKFSIKYNNIRNQRVQEIVWMNYDPYKNKRGKLF